jgi:hypothetical protein
MSAKRSTQKKSFSGLKSSGHFVFNGKDSSTEQSYTRIAISHLGTS